MAKCILWSLHLIGWWASDIFLVVVPFWLFPAGIELMMKTWRRISEPIIKMVIRQGIMKKAMMKVIIMMTLGQNYNDNDSDKGECYLVTSPPLPCPPLGLPTTYWRASLPGLNFPFGFENLVLISLGVWITSWSYFSIMVINMDKCASFVYRFRPAMSSCLI